MNFFISAATKLLLGVGTPINEASLLLVSSVSFFFAALAFFFSAAKAFFPCKSDSRVDAITLVWTSFATRTSVLGTRHSPGTSPRKFMRLEPIFFP
jgi:hypothetical protein